MGVDNKEKKRIARRGFLKGATIGVAGAAASALSGCAATPTPEVIEKVVETPVEVVKEVKPWLPEKWDEEADVLVLGAGIGGLVAAVEASTQGAQVTVLDKMDVIGGTSLQHGGQFCAYGPTSVQKQMNVELGPEDTKENYYKLLTYGREDVLNLDLVNLVTEHCNEAVEWALSIGSKFTAVVNTNALPFLPARPWTHNSEDGGYGYAQVLKKNLEANGGTILLKHRALELIINPEGEVLGAKVDADGVTKYFKAKRAVVLATGGFFWNKEMVRQYASRAIDANPYASRPHETGDGIKMAQAVGADLCCMEWGGTLAPGTVKPTPDEFWPPRLPGSTQPPTRPTLNIGTSTPGIYVTKRGLRFANEALAGSYLGHILAGQEEGIVWAVFDAAALGDKGGKAVSQLFEDDIEKEVAAGYVFKADSVRELAEAIGIVPPENLVAQVDRYNAAVAAGSDVEFGKPEQYLATIKQAPFYATQVGKQLIVGLGGLRTNTNAEILDTQGEPIARLYGVGRVTGGYMAKWYPTGGSTLGEMTIIGRIAGKNATAWTPWE